MKSRAKKDFPVQDIRQFLEPGPVLLVSSAWKDRRNIMTMGWHAVIEYTPSLVGCVIAESNVSFEMIRRSRQCVLNVPTANMVRAVVGIGNCDGDTVDKFARYKLTAQKATHVQAPLIAECHASLECRLYDASLVKKYNFFIWEVIKAHVAPAPKFPKMLHYRGEGKFFITGSLTNQSRHFTKWRGLPNF